ncbi:MAG: F0F1 ATP synthase subunit epsilon [Actinobacteria bacterium]|uniref:F0F1 ATP synthase subunit epsilon n=1 Tax=Candidatus Fonsibacter lacus TaxID=2576439 RepID=A0A965LKV5_9PROT|nr:F0F1 ATP synthase subunit epsilon [Candidatus Fonsibacter lacus]
MALRVEVVTPEKKIFSGEASMVQARTLAGDLGILPGHISLLGVLVDGEVVVKETNGQSTTFTINGGFLSVNKDRVSILGESSN